MKKTVDLAPEDGLIRDSRRLVRTLTGKTQGAIKDFQASIEFLDRIYPSINNSENPNCDLIF